MAMPSRKHMAIQSVPGQGPELGLGALGNNPKIGLGTNYLQLSDTAPQVACKSMRISTSILQAMLKRRLCPMPVKEHRTEATSHRGITTLSWISTYCSRCDTRSHARAHTHTHSHHMYAHMPGTCKTFECITIYTRHRGYTL